MRRSSWQLILFTAAGALLASWIALPCWAQRQGRGPRAGAPMYNTATEVTLQGSVEAIKQITGPRSWGGTHLSLKTEKETIDVHVGPSWFLTQHKMTFAKGDPIEVTGSRIKFGNEDAVLAREIKKGGEMLTLRNAQGIPVWAGGPRG